ncbi:hypothetical protein [Hymenobacter glacieicola]|uniref:Uncharacterized protein n=1 Tax=Hymenobacter glacieicola TaxID=1562124 RepID=A0ABQ1WG12_9BACT|nr:hypothetical protein [Hymenobacter glacieicola]GGG27352.1 hypothetical protein GCM10011378_00170 [Hymenobacter glacieicola]
MKALHTFALTFAMLLLLVVGAHFAQAARLSLPAGHGSVEQRTRNLTNYLTRELHLSRPQRKIVEKSTRNYLQQLDRLAVKPGLVAAVSEGRLLEGKSITEVENEYDTALARVFTPGQYSAYSWLREHQPEGSR